MFFGTRYNFRKSQKIAPIRSRTLLHVLWLKLVKFLIGLPYLSLDIHDLSCGISSLLHSVNLILFTLLLVHFILRISPHHSHHLRSHHTPLPRPFIPDLKFIFFHKSFLRSFSVFQTAFSYIEPVPD